MPNNEFLSDIELLCVGAVVVMVIFIFLWNECNKSKDDLITKDECEKSKDGLITEAECKYKDLSSCRKEVNTVNADCFIEACNLHCDEMIGLPEDKDKCRRDCIDASMKYLTTSCDTVKVQGCYTGCAITLENGSEDYGHCVTECGSS